MLFIRAVNRLNTSELQVQVVDIADNKDVDAGAYNAATDPQLVASAKAKRGPLKVGWFQVHDFQPPCPPVPPVPRHTNAYLDPT